MDSLVLHCVNDRSSVLWVLESYIEVQLERKAIPMGWRACFNSKNGYPNLGKTLSYGGIQ